ncbi:hypothetical protein AB1Y20_003629 [Prymnesium parvum]|uniref:Centrosomal protein of 162 kDa n=1 Tax=Prymnesium parvum TaxID=97485 RepID=A0AB34J870_PRYPA
MPSPLHSPLLAPSYHSSALHTPSNQTPVHHSPARQPPVQSAVAEPSPPQQELLSRGVSLPPALPSHLEGYDPVAPSHPLALSSVGAGGQLRGLILQKEKELHDINEYRIQTLEALLQDKERELSDGKARLGKLRDDFNYNLKLLSERDAELERYDASFTHLKSVLRDRDGELSELQISVAELRQAAKQERERLEENESYYQHKLQQEREDWEAARWKLDESLRSLRDECEAYKREASRAAREHEEAVARERRESASGFDEAMREREREHSSRVAELEAALHAVEGEKKRAEAALSEQSTRVASLDQCVEVLTSSLRQRERMVEELTAESERREARDASRLQETERLLGELEHLKDEKLEEKAEEIRALQQQLAASERALTARRRRSHADVIARLEARLAETREKLQQTEGAVVSARVKAAEAAAEADEKLRAAQRELEELRQQLERSEARAAKVEAVAAATREEAQQTAEQAVEVARREAISLRAELAAAHDAMSDTRRQLTHARNEAADLRAAEAEANKRVDELTRAAKQQALRDAAALQLREALDASSELEASLATAKNDTARALAAKAAADERTAAAEKDLHAKQEELHRAQQLLQQQEHRLGPYARGGLGVLTRADDEESLPSPVSIPSLPISPMAKGGRFGKGGGVEEENALLKARLARAEEQAEKSRHVVVSMRQELERLRGGGASGGVAEELSAAHEQTHALRQYNELLAQRCEGLAHGIDGGAATAEIHVLRARVKSLEETGAYQRAERREVQAEVERLRMEAAESARHVRALEAGVLSKETMIAQLQSRVTEATAQLEAKSKECEALRAEREGGGLVRELQAKLKTCEADHSRLVAEREKLMEISNMLRADLNRVLSESPAPPSSTIAIERAEREVAGRYEAKLGQIESSMRQLVSQNRSLKEELHRWTASEPDEWRASRRAISTSRSFDRAQSDGEAEEGEEEEEYGEAWRGEARRPRSAAGGGEVSGARARARAKLEEAKSSLLLSGTTAPRVSCGARASAPPSNSSRATESQTRARLQDIQRKRADLSRRRGSVRNYNDVDDELEYTHSMCLKPAAG